MFYVYSKAVRTGYISHGTKAFPREEAQSYADDLNRDPNNKGLLVFWVEAAEMVLK